MYVRNKDIFIYCMPPMDFGWEHLPTLKEHMATALREVGADNFGQYTLSTAQHVMQWVERATDQARHSGWDGDIRDGKPVRVMVLPDGDTSYYVALIWKQDNNGTTFVASPMEMPWLSEHLVKPADVVDQLKRSIFEFPRKQ